MLFASCDLLGVEVPFGAVAPRDQHRVSHLTPCENGLSLLFFPNPLKAEALGWVFKSLIGNLEG
jgi:hypothetical protein